MGIDDLLLVAAVRQIEEAHDEGYFVFRVQAVPERLGQAPLSFSRFKILS